MDFKTRLKNLFSSFGVDTENKEGIDELIQSAEQHQSNANSTIESASAESAQTESESAESATTATENAESPIVSALMTALELQNTRIANLTSRIEGIEKAANNTSATIKGMSTTLATIAANTSNIVLKESVAGTQVDTVIENNDAEQGKGKSSNNAIQVTMNDILNTANQLP